MATAADVQARDRIFIGGEWVEPHGTDSFEVINLRNEVLGIAASRLRRRLEETASADPETAALLERVVRRELDPASAASELMERQAGE